LVAERRNGGFAGWQTMLGQEFGDGAIRGTLLPKLRDDFFGLDQILEAFWTARHEIRDRLADCGWIKRGHKPEGSAFEPGNQ
jgi:hypothetical protein